MADQYTLEQEIRSYYRDAYQKDAEKRLPWRTKFSKALLKGGVAGIFGGFVGMAAAGVMACLSAPVVLPVLIGSAGLIPSGVLGFLSSKKLYRRIEKIGEQMMTQDIASLKLVKSYVRQVFVEKTTLLRGERDSAVKAHDIKLKELDRQNVLLTENRKTALVIISNGMDQLERQIDASRREVDFFRKEAETLGVEFASAAQQPVAGAAAAPIAITNVPKLQVPSKSN
jgi:hypothetical protein